MSYIYILHIYIIVYIILFYANINYKIVYSNTSSSIGNPASFDPHTHTHSFVRNIEGVCECLVFLHWNFTLPVGWIDPSLFNNGDHHLAPKNRRIGKFPECKPTSTEVGRAKAKNTVGWGQLKGKENKYNYLLLIFTPPRTGFGGCLLPSANEVVLGRPLIVTPGWLSYRLLWLIIGAISYNPRELAGALLGSSAGYHLRLNSSHAEREGEKTCRCCWLTRTQFTLNDDGCRENERTEFSQITQYAQRNAETHTKIYSTHT